MTSRKGLNGISTLMSATINNIGHQKSTLSSSKIDAMTATTGLGRKFNMTELYFLLSQ
jgi:hypothetical protein